MCFNRNKVLIGKISLLTILLVAGLVILGCAGIRSTPQGGSGMTIADGTLFVCPALKQAGGFGCSAPAAGESKLEAVNISDGSRLWEVALETSKPAGGGFSCTPAPTSVAIYGTPAVSGDLIYVGSYDGGIYAISASSRLSNLKYLNEDNPQPIVGGPVAALGKVYVGSSDGKVYALDAATSDKVWEFPTGDKIWSTPTIDGDTLYIGSFDKKLYALDATGGSKKWEFMTEGAIVSTPTVYNNTVYFGSFDRYLYAVNTADGSLKWKFMAENWFWARPLAYNNVIYAGCLDHRLYALNAETGDKIAEFDLESPVSSSPVLVDDKIIAASQEGKVYSLDTGNNQIRLLAELGGQVYAPLSASEGVVYINSMDQTLHALNVDSGLQLWSLSLSN